MRLLIGLAFVVSLFLMTSVAAMATTIPAGTEVTLRTLELLDSQANRVGDPVTFELVEDIVVDGKVVVSAGAIGVGVMIHVRTRSTMGNYGQLRFKINYLDTPGGRIPLEGTYGHSPKGKHGEKIFLRLFFLGPIGALTTKGHKITVDWGTVVPAYTTRDVDVRSFNQERFLASVEESRMKEAADCLWHFGFDGREMGKDVFLGMGITYDQLVVSPMDDGYSFIVSVEGTNMAWIVRPDQTAYWYKFRERKIRPLDDQDNGSWRECYGLLRQVS